MHTTPPSERSASASANLTSSVVTSLTGAATGASTSGLPIRNAGLAQVVSGVTIGSGSGMTSAVTVAPAPNSVACATPGCSTAVSQGPPPSMTNTGTRVAASVFHTRPPLSVEPLCATQTSQVFEFNHAISYVQQDKESISESTRDL